MKSDFVVPISEVGEDLGSPFLAMEYRHGLSLDHFLRERRRSRPPWLIRRPRPWTHRPTRWWSTFAGRVVRSPRERFGSPPL
ncbi:MAG: hypothetical protein K2P78_10990, partial [Gemmataceae bacterium]|nr:hypothetical protein [Gemmataceae bacterium]